MNLHITKKILLIFFSLLLFAVTVSAQATCILNGVGEVTQSDPDISAMVGPRSVFVLGDYAYVAAAGGDSLAVVDVSDPSAPTIVGTLALDNFFLDLFVSGRYAYVIINDFAGIINDLRVIDISNPALPTTVGTLNIDGDGLNGLFVSGRYAYVIDGSSDDLKVIDISNPSLPAIVGTVGLGRIPNKSLSRVVMRMWRIHQAMTSR